MARLLVTGVSGLLGGNLAVEAAGQHQVTGVFNANMVVVGGIQTLRADLSRPAEVQRTFESTQPDWVIHCAAATDIDRAERDPDWAFRLNRDMPRLLAEAARETGARFVYISTDAVFDGEGAPIVESVLPQPTTVYGESKLAGEQAALKASPGSVVVRTNFFGWSPVRARSLAEWFLDHLVRGEACPGFTDVRFSPILVNDLAGALLKLLALGASGVYHIGGATCLSKYEFGRRVAMVFGLDQSLIRPASVDEAGLRAPRSKYLCLNSRRAELALGMSMPFLEDGLERFKALAWRSSSARLLNLS